MCVFGVSIAVYLPATESIVYKYFISIAQSRNMKYWKLTHNCNIAKQEGDKIPQEGDKIQSCSCRFLPEKA